jgi:aldehyde dehydrogenase (NAD+)
MASSTTAADRRDRFHKHLAPALDVRPYINGRFVDASDGTLLQVNDPMTGSRLLDVVEATSDVVGAAVAAARTAFDDGPWPRMHPRERGEYLFALANLIDRDLEDLVLVEAIDTGKRYLGVQGWDVPNAAEVYRYYAGWSDKVIGEVLPSSEGLLIYSRTEPVGVCAAIIPWNFPFPCTSWKIGPALAAGCTVVIKPSDRAPLSGHMLAKLVDEVGFPPGVVNVVSGRGEVTGAALVSDTRVDKISFTGDIATARRIVTGSMARLPRLTLELGGKNPNVVFADADLDRAVPGTIEAIFSVSGQNCCSGSRTIVHASIVEEFVERLRVELAHRKLGDQLDDSTDQGPQIDAAHISRIRAFVQDALADGATSLIGDPTKDLSPFFPPTILANASLTSRISREEVFGPVGTLYTFETDEEAIALSNDTEFGLCASIWTNDRGRVDKAVREIRAGTCWVNCFGYFDTVAPWGGVKLSGVGRELGRLGIEAYLEPKTVFDLA